MAAKAKPGRPSRKGRLAAGLRGAPLTAADAAFMVICTLILCIFWRLSPHLPPWLAGIGWGYAALEAAFFVLGKFR